jgi:hypothetical protein
MGLEDLGSALQGPNVQIRHGGGHLLDGNQPVWPVEEHGNSGSDHGGNFRFHRGCDPVRRGGGTGPRLLSVRLARRFEKGPRPAQGRLDLSRPAWLIQPGENSMDQGQHLAEARFGRAEAVWGAGPFVRCRFLVAHCLVAALRRLQRHGPVLFRRAGFALGQRIPEGQRHDGAGFGRRDHIGDHGFLGRFVR